MDDVCDITKSISYKFKNNIIHIGQDGHLIMSKIKKDSRYLELLDTALFIEGEDNLFQLFIENTSSVIVEKSNTIERLCSKYIQIKEKDFHSDESIEIVHTLDIDEVVDEFKIFLETNYDGFVDELGKTKQDMEDKAYISVTFTGEDRKLIQTSIEMYENAMDIDYRGIDELDSIAKAHVKTNIKFYENIIHQLENIKENKTNEFIFHAIFYDLITYCVGLALEVYKGDLEYKNLMHHFPCVFNTKRYQELTDEDYLDKSEKYNRIYLRMLNIRSENKELIDFYSKVLYFEYSKKDTGYRMGLFNNPLLSKLFTDGKDISHLRKNATIINESN